MEWSALERATGAAGSVFGDSVAQLVSHGFIDCAPERVGCLGAILRKEPRYFMAITPLGAAYLREFGHTSAAEDARDRQLQETPEERRNAIEEVVRLAMDSFSPKPIYGIAKHREAIARLDADVLQELEATARDEQAMWQEFERRFGHRGPTSVGAETELRDPVILRTTVRMFRAMDEQLRRMGLPASRKPTAWVTHYHNGDMSLPPAPWSAQVQP